MISILIWILLLSNIVFFATMLINGSPSNLISIRDRGLLYGDGVFRTLRVSNGQALHWSLHYQKLQHDCAAIGIRCPDFAQLSAELEVLLSQNSIGSARTTRDEDTPSPLVGEGWGEGDSERSTLSLTLPHQGGGDWLPESLQPKLEINNCAIKLIVTRGISTRGYAPATQTTSTHIWDVAPLPDYPAAWSTHGIKARLCQLRLSQQPRLAGIKHLNRLENVLAASEWNDTEIAEGLLMDADGNVIEGVRSNLFAVLSGTLTTPSLLGCGVAGIQRDRVISWANTNNVPLEIRTLSWEEVINAEELFIVNSLIGVWPIRELEQRHWKQFAMAHRVQLSLNV
ncbi:MAG: aminodeoxychorismate lyase, partial [Gallionella sp.]|nr:aminodeoxychorismate lyase [Gallionella sp.]